MIFTGGDWRYFWPETLAGLARLPSSWDSSLNTGVGMPSANTLWITSYLNFTAYIGSVLGLQWETVMLLLWVLPAVILSFLSMFLLFRYLFPSDRYFGVISAVIYGANSYIQMVFLGGQIGVSLAYALMPLVILGFLNAYKKPELRRGFLAGLLLSTQVLFDPRFALLSIVVSILYWIIFYRQNVVKQAVFSFFVPLGVMLLLHSYWILPIILFHFPALPTGFSSQDGFQFFSFGDFSHSITLLHPNWPENIFGKVYFLRFQFLLLPILAFSSLLFLSKKEESKKVIFFAGLAIISVFLSKGSKEPFGFLSGSLFQHIPFMGLFRDSTKFYALIALSYAALLPYTLSRLSEVLKKYARLSLIKRYAGLVVVSLFFLGWVVLHSPIYFEGRTRILTSLPNQYKVLKEFLITEDGFYRTLWIPQWQRYGYFSDQHPAIGRNELFTTTDPLQMARELTGKQDILTKLQVKYIIIPYDSEKELFLGDRKYSDPLRKKTEQIIDKIPWLTKKEVVSGISVYEVSGKKRRFWLDNESDITWKMQSPTHYFLQHREIDMPSQLIFSEAFDNHWRAKTKDGKEIAAIDAEGVMSFPLQKKETITEIYFYPQHFVLVGLLISGATLVTVTAFLLLKSRVE